MVYGSSCFNIHGILTTVCPQRNRSVFTVNDSSRLSVSIHTVRIISFNGNRTIICRSSVSCGHTIRTIAGNNNILLVCNLAGTISLHTRRLIPSNRNKIFICNNTIAQRLHSNGIFTVNNDFALVYGSLNAVRNSSAANRFHTDGIIPVKRNCCTVFINAVSFLGMHTDGVISFHDNRAVICAAAAGSKDTVRIFTIDTNCSVIPSRSRSKSLHTVRIIAVDSDGCISIISHGCRFLRIT